MCKAACCPRQGNSDPEEEDSLNFSSSTHMRSSIIRNILREDNDNFVLRRAVLEQFFSDVSKCLTAKDLLSDDPLKMLSSFTSSSSSSDDDDNNKNNECDVESGLKCDTEEDTKPSSSKGETVGTPRTLCTLCDSDHSTDTDTDGDSSGCDQHEQEECPILRRSLIQDSENSNNDYNECDLEVIPLSSDNEDGERIVTKPSECQECNTISKGGKEATICSDIDTLERGAQEQHVDTENDDDICPICLDAWDEGDFIIESKHCSHQFHKSCILLWLEKNDQCPCCRAQMITEEEVQATALSVVGTQRLYSVINELTMMRGDSANI